MLCTDPWRSSVHMLSLLMVITTVCLFEYHHSWGLLLVVRQLGALARLLVSVPLLMAGGVVAVPLSRLVAAPPGHCHLLVSC